MENISFSEKVLAWFDVHGRTGLPWQQDINAYRVWVSEIMLQQTQVKTVIPYFERFMETFPTVLSLANAEQDEVLKHWSGLGYYARARNMHAAAKTVRDDFNGVFPNDIESIQTLKGIGRSTGAAVLSIASNQPEPILDGNVKRVLSRVFAVEGWSGKAAVLKKLWLLAEETTPSSRNADYTQAIMDLGATLCTRNKPQCEACPLVDDCIAKADETQDKFPAKKPKKEIPEKYTTFLIIENETSEVMMLKRPPVGIWGGLWCFPQFDHEKQASSLNNAHEWLRSYSGETELEVEFEDSLEIQEMTPLTHVFSHFKLHIQPLKIKLKRPITSSVMENHETLWYNIKTEFDGGLAAPVTTLINTLREQGKYNDENG